MISKRRLNNGHAKTRAQVWGVQGAYRNGAHQEGMAVEPFGASVQGEAEAA